MGCYKIDYNILLSVILWVQLSGDPKNENVNVPVTQNSGH